MFFPEEVKDGHHLEDGKMHRAHIILGLAVKDTCVTPNYLEKQSMKKKRKGDSEAEVNGNAHRAKQRRMDAASSAVTSVRNPSSDSEGVSKQQQPNNKKPTGYSFLDKTKSSRVCDLLVNRIQENGANAASNYMEKYLRTPRLSSLIVPTFSFVNDMSTNSSEEKRYKLKKHETKTSQQMHCESNVIPKSTKDAVSINTPHGWQSIQPEQYCDAVSSLMGSTKSDLLPSRCEGAVGLFDHVDLSSTQADSLFLDNSTAKNCNINGESETSTTKEQARKQALKRITISVQKNNDWAYRAQRRFQNGAQSTKFWLPVQMLASQLPSHVLFTTLKIHPNLNGQHYIEEQKMLSNHSNIAIIGWDALICGKNQRRDVLRNLIDTLQSPNTNPKRFLLLAVNDLQSILDAAREGISIIGSDLARHRSRNGMALCFHFACKDSKVEEIDLKEKHFARDFGPLLSNCTCLACRPLQQSPKNVRTDKVEDLRRPSFTRAYIHHLIQAKELLAEILLFAHNLHQLLLLFRQLSDVAALDEGKGENEHIEAFCMKLEQSLAGYKPT